MAGDGLIQVLQRGRIALLLVFNFTDDLVHYSVAFLVEATVHAIPLLHKSCDEGGTHGASDG